MQENTQKTSGKKIWSRLLYMILFAIVFGITETVVYITALVAFASMLVRGSINPSILGFGKNLGKFVNQIVEFLTFNTEDLPFPFTAWPDEPAKANDKPTADPHMRSAEESESSRQKSDMEKTAGNNSDSTISPPQKNQTDQPKPETID